MAVPSYPQYRDAARRVDGVTSVHNRLMVMLPPSDYRHDLRVTG
jgi:osmotically-inducible protein OsmY